MNADTARRVRARAGSRLHLGLIDPGGSSGRRYGGVGLIVEEPAVLVEACFDEPRSRDAADAPGIDPAVLARRDAVLRELVGTTHANGRTWCRVLASPSLHSGLGTGTQLGLAIAAAIDRLHRGAAGVEELARSAGRGTRSAIGVRGFAEGGLLIDGGQTSAGAIAPLVARCSLPESWRVVLALPEGRGASGAEERRAFETMPDGADRAAELARVDRLARIALLGVAPAALEGDFEAFSDAVWEFGRLAAEPFRAAQGGVFASARIACAVESLRAAGARGVAQSSWGPATLAFARDGEEAERFARAVAVDCDLSRDRVRVTRARNQGAEISEQTAGSRT